MTAHEVGGDDADERRGAFPLIRRALCGLVATLLTAIIVPVVSAQSQALDDEVTAQARLGAPSRAEPPDDIPPWARSGFALSLGLGTQYASLGGQVSYEWAPPPGAFVLAPYASAGVLVGGGGLHAEPGFCAGVMGMYGSRYRWILDLGYAALFGYGFRFGGILAAERVIYGVTAQTGVQWMNQPGFFLRALIGAGLSIDSYVPLGVHLALTLALGVKL